MNECIPVEEMGTLAQLPEDDERRRHAATCPRCSSLLFVYDEFVQAKPVESADPNAAETHLARFIAAHVGGTEEAAQPVSVAQRLAPRRWFDATGWRLAVVAAAVVLVAVAVSRWQPWTTHEIIYRGEPAAHFTGLRATAGIDSFELGWDAVPGADSYLVTILAQDLDVVARLAPTTDTTARFGPGVERRNGKPFYWQVTAMAEGGELLTSDPQPLP